MNIKLIAASSLVLMLLLSQMIVFSQVNSGGLPLSSLTDLGKKFETKTLPGFDVEGMINEDRINSAYTDVPYRYGKVFEVDYDLTNSGSWYILPDGSRVWRLAIRSENAASINLFYKEFYMPKGALFYLYNEDKSELLGAFSDLNNTADKYFSTAPTRGETTILEYYEPQYSKSKGVIRISQVVHAYKDIYGLLSPAELSCNININCPIGAPWVEQKRSVTRITFIQGGSGYLCTGSLINNTTQDRSLLYLTAEHCAPDNHSSMVFFFNYENPTCYGSAGSLSQTISGATLKASNYATDFRLVLLNGTLPASFNGYFNGWDRSGNQPTNEVAIHHPGGANKKISIDNNPATNSNGFGGRLVNGFWQVVWDFGMTEGGSSGCPLYDQNKRVVGQNLGGVTSQCENPQAVTKVFGKFSQSWGYGGSAGNQLKDWLDPTNSNVITLDGIPALTGVAPVSNFTSDTSNLPLGGGSINFFDLSMNVPTSWSWSFPGGTPSTSNVKNPANISYTQTGAYTVSLTATNQYGSNTYTLLNYIKVAGLPLNAFTLISPPTNTTIMVSAQDPSTTDFVWGKSAPGSSIKYMYKIKKLGAGAEYTYTSNNGGLDTIISVRKSFLDSLGTIFGYTGDSVRCSWRAASTNGVDTILSSGSNLLTIRRSTIGITQISSSIPASFMLYNNYPNPFNPSTIINFDVPQKSSLRIKIYNALGEVVYVLADRNFEAGKYSVDFDGSNLASGIYFYSLEGENLMQVKRMVLVK
ncbi:MAG TPA: T9SS type A sorting domain-containing protein [Ignavibacteria bacterium]|nr:T9SS type A sorting domain-containing protein [Ignavibacteria bacterium]HMR00007.1 T9SS type A sorting domain-containing protein [Ignavibacteria bacterium]